MQIFREVDSLNDVENLMIILFAIVAPLSASAKAFIAAKNRLTAYRYHHAQMLIDKTISTNSGKPLPSPVPPLPARRQLRGCSARASCCRVSWQQARRVWRGMQGARCSC